MDDVQQTKLAAMNIEMKLLYTLIHRKALGFNLLNSPFRWAERAYIRGTKQISDGNLRSKNSLGF